MKPGHHKTILLMPKNIHKKKAMANIIIPALTRISIFYTPDLFINIY